MPDDGVIDLTCYAGRIFCYPGDVIEIRAALRPKSLRYGDEGRILGFREGYLTKMRRTDLSDEERAARDAENRKRSMMRSKAQVRRACMMLEVDRMVTLTTRANIQDLDRWQELTGKFFRAYQEKYPRFVYVAVDETQERGAWHTHYATRGWLDLGFARELWQSLNGGPGMASINIKYEPECYARSRGMPVPVSIAQYIAKYFAKQDLGMYRHRYRGTLVNVEGQAIRINATAWVELKAELEFLMRQHGLQTALRYEARDWGSLTVLGWEKAADG